MAPVTCTPARHTGKGPECWQAACALHCARHLHNMMCRTDALGYEQPVRSRPALHLVPTHGSRQGRSSRIAPALRPIHVAKETYEAEMLPKERTAVPVLRKAEMLPNA